MTGEEMSDAEIMPLFEAARWAPSSYNNQPWRFLYVKRDTSHWNTLFDLLVDLVQLVVLPMFLFSGTFYPIDAYPEALQLFVRLTPLYQGVDLIRSLTVGVISPILLVHVVYLTVMGTVGLAVTSRRLDQLLLK